MRGLRSFLLLLAVCAGLAAYLYFVESKRDPSDADKKDKVFTVEADKIDEMTVKSETGEQTTLKKTGTEWQIVAPVAAAPDGAAVSGLTSNLSTLELQRVIEENPQDLAEYGLAQPRLEVSFKAGGTEHRLQIGRKTPAATDLYAKLGDQKRVFLIPASSIPRSTKRPSTCVTRRSSKSIETRSMPSRSRHAARILQFAKADGEWQHVRFPLKARADFTTVDGLVEPPGHTADQVDRRRRGHRARRVRPRQACHDHPARDQDLAGNAPHRQDGRRRRGLCQGPVAAGGHHHRRHARGGRRQGRWRVPAEGSLRCPRLQLDTPRSDAQRTDAVFDKTKTKNKEGRTRRSGNSRRRPHATLDQTTVDNLISAITAARATSFVDSAAKTGLDKPELLIALTSDDGKRVEKVTLARSGADGYGAREGEAGTAKVDAATIDNIIKSFEAVK